MGGVILMICEYCKDHNGIEVNFDIVTITAEDAAEYEEYEEGQKVYQCNVCKIVEDYNG